MASSRRKFDKVEAFYQAVEKWPAEDWEPLWDAFLARVKHVVGLQDASEMGDAT